MRGWNARVGAALLLLGCGGAGPYGYAREYVPLDAEEPHHESANPAGYEEVRRSAEDYTSETIAWFGVVDRVEVDEATGEGTLRLNFRVLQPRNLCEAAEEDTCRVTVSQREGGPFTVQVALRPGDRAGEDRVWIGSLVRVFGTPTGEVDEEHGPALRATWYRHWPRGQYVTTGAAHSMRR